MSSSKKPVAGPYEAILESISDGVFTIDLDWRIRTFNRAAERITGVPRREALGRRCSDVFRSDMCGEDCPLHRTVKTGKPVIGVSGYIIDADGNRVPISVSTAVLGDERGRVMGGAETFRELSDIEALRQELEGHYRVGDLSSRSPLMQRVYEVLPAIATSPSTVLIFREDLYYRVNVVRVELPPLRSRKEDIPLLVDQCVARFNRLQQRTVRGVDAEALSLLMAHDWPGNIRELENAIERAFVLCRDGYIGLSHLPEEFRARGTAAGERDDMRSAHDLLDAQAIRAALERHGDSRVEAARALGIHKTTLFRRIRKLGLDLPEQDGRSRGGRRPERTGSRHRKQQ